MAFSGDFALTNLDMIADPSGDYLFEIIAELAIMLTSRTPASELTIEEQS